MRISFLLLIALLFGSNLPAKAAPSTNTVLDRVSVRVKDWQKLLPEVKISADEAAEKAVNGYEIFIAGSQRSFIEEPLGRSGGLVLPQYWGPGVPLHAKDTVLAGISGDAALSDKYLDTLLKTAEAAHATVILFDSTNEGRREKLHAQVAAGEIQFLPHRNFKDVAAPGQLSIDSISNVIGLWSWTAEFVTGCINRGKTPTMLLSIGMPGGKERDPIYQSHMLRWHPYNVPAAPNQELARQYLSVLQWAIDQARANDEPAIQHAAALIHTARKAGGVVRIDYLSHMFPSEFIVPQNPPWMVDATSKLEAGPNDVDLTIGYQAFPYARMLAGGNPWIVTSSQTPPLEFKANADKQVYIDPFWAKEDAVVNLVGYDIKVFPISGIMQSSIYWRLVEASR